MRLPPASASTAPREVSVTSTLVLVEYRLERQRTWAALVEHTLRDGPQGLQIAAKRVDLVNCDAAFGNIQLFM